MSKRILWSSLFIAILFASGIYASILWWDEYQTETIVTFLSVGEGDALLLSQGSNQIIIDGGRNGKNLLARLGRHIPFWDRTIEIVIATHPDADHIGGLLALFSAYHIDNFLFTGAESKTDVFVLLKKALEKNQTTLSKVFRESTVQLPKGGLLSVEYPQTTLPEETTETNKGSLVIRFIYGKTSMLFTGDLPSEETLIPDTLPADILKVSHHGSRYSTSSAFLDRLTPREAVISVGKNSYGHPSPDVLKRLEERNIIIHRTDRDGDIQYVCTEISKQCVFVE